MRFFRGVFTGDFPISNLVEESDDGTGSFSKRGFVDFFFVGGPGGPAFPDDALPFCIEVLRWLDPATAI